MSEIRGPEKWIEDYLAGELRPDDAVELEKWVIEHPAHAERFVRSVWLDSQMRAAFTGRRYMSGFSIHATQGTPEDDEGDIETIDREILDELVEQALAARRRREIEDAANAHLLADLRVAAAEKQQEPAPDSTFKTRTIVIPRSLVWISTAALITLVASLFIDTSPETSDSPATVSSNPSPPTQSVPVIGRVINDFNAMTDEAGQAFTAGQELPKGEYVLQHGVVELALADGARIVLEAPVSFELVGTNEISLSRGSLVAHVPDSAHGFAVQTPSARFIDHGTAFGVQIDGLRQVGTHVFSGAVEVQTNDNKSLWLYDQQSASVDEAGRAQHVTSSLASRFLTQVPETAYQAAIMRSRPMCYWRGDLDETTGLLKDYGWLGADGRPARQLNSSTIGPDPLDSSGAISFETPGAGWVTVPFHESFRFDGPLTLEVWCWIEPGDREFMRVVSTRSDSGGIGLGVNGSNASHSLALIAPKSAPVFTVFGEADYAGENPLPEGQWVHLVATLDTDGQVEIYVDGAAIPLRQRVFPSDADAVQNATNAVPLMIGRNPFTGQGTQGWWGKLDEIAIYDRALTPDEVRKHFHAHQYP